MRYVIIYHFARPFNHWMISDRIAAIDHLFGKEFASIVILVCPDSVDPNIEMHNEWLYRLNFVQIAAINGVGGKQQVALVVELHNLWN